MNQQLSTIYYDLNKIIDPFVVDDTINIVREQLDRGNIKSIIDAMYKNTKILANGIPFIKVQGISTLLRTSNSGFERVLIYDGIPNLLPRSSIVEIDGYDYISGHSFISILDNRIANTRENTKEYLKIALDIENGIIIFKEIHADMTRLGIHTYDETFKYCERKGYSLDWA